MMRLDDRDVDVAAVFAFAARSTAARHLIGASLHLAAVSKACGELLRVALVALGLAILARPLERRTTMKR